MSLLGKLLAIVNVLAVVGALALMGMVYGKRSTWQYQVFRQQLMETGLPVDPAERDEMDRSLAGKIDSETQKDLFKDAAPNAPVATQLDEVKRVKDELNRKIEGAGDKKKQIYMYSRILTPMAVTYEQRKELHAYQTYLRDDAAFKKLHDRLGQADKTATQQIKDGKAKKYDEAFHEALAAQFVDPPGPLAEAFLAAKKADMAGNVDKLLDPSLDPQLAELKRQFDEMFQSTTAGTGGTEIGSKSGATRQKRRVIAYLLLNMVDVLPDEAPGGAAAKPANIWEDPKYKRFLKVVGVQAAAEALETQASLLKDIAAEVDTERLRERGLFALEHDKAVTLVQEKAVEVDRHTRLLELKQKEQTAHEENLKKRELDVKFYQEQLAKARKKTADDLDVLRRMSDQLLKERVKLRDATEDNQRLEKDIRALEGVR
ncbi:MAG TPA: hypothetical protein VH643_01320 [Gemmataceae bacterium]|jgi:hypothetical protein